MKICDCELKLANGIFLQTFRKGLEDAR